MSSATLAVDGGAPVRAAPWPQRRLFGEEERNAVLRLFDDAIETGAGIGYNGAPEQAYRDAFAEFQGGGYAHTVNSGTAAVYVALRTLEIEPKGEVIVPPDTDPGSIMPVALLNCTPVPADSAPGTLNVSAESIAARLTEKTRAIMAVHLSGVPVDMEPILDLAARANVPIIEDCAQAHGALYKGRKVGTFGDIAAFSTMHTKHHSTGGVGGIVFTRRSDLAKRLPLYADRGKPPVEEADWRVLSACRRVATLNFNLGDLPATIGAEQLKKLPEFLSARRTFMGRLAEACETLQCFRVATWGAPIENCAFWFGLFNVDTTRLGVDVARLATMLAAEGVPISAPNDLELANRSPWYQDRKVFGAGGSPDAAPWDAAEAIHLPNADAALASHLMLDIHERLGETEVNDVVAVLRKIEDALL